MPVALSKGENVNLTREDPGLTNIIIGLGWDLRDTDGEAFDLDASAFLLDADGKIISDGDFVFYNNLVSPCGSVMHTGDNLTGEGDGDDEALKVNLTTLPPMVERIAICVSIHMAEQRQQNFGMVENAFIRVVNDRTNHEIARFDLSEDASVETAMVFGDLYRYGAEWKFRAVAQGFPGGLGEVARYFAVNVD